MESIFDFDIDNTNPMAHKEALETKAVERYLLGGLKGEERTRFEEHYFECQNCATAVAAGQKLLWVSKPVRDRWWRQLAFRVLVPTLAATVIVVGLERYSTVSRYQSQLASLAMPQGNTVIVAHPQEKGDLESEALDTDSVSLEMSLPESASSPFYRVEISGAGRKSTSQVARAPKGSRISWHLMRQSLGLGSFTVVLYGLQNVSSDAGVKLETYYFNIK